MKNTEEGRGEHPASNTSPLRAEQANAEAEPDPTDKLHYCREMRGLRRSLLVTLFPIAVLLAAWEAAQIWTAQHMGQPGSASFAAPAEMPWLASAVSAALFVIPVTILLLLALAAFQAGAGARRLNALVAEQAEAHQERMDALLRRQSLLSAALAGTEDAAIAADTAGRITLLNPAAEKLTGWQETDALGRPVRSVLTLVDERGAALADFSAGVLANARRHDIPVGAVQVARGGGRRPVAGSAALFQEDTGEPGGLVLVFRDVSERQKREADLRELTAQRGIYEARLRALENDLTERRGAAYLAEEALRLEKASAQALALAQNHEKSILLGDMSDELRTPLSAILGYSEMLQEEAEDEGLISLAPDLQKIHKAGEHLLSLINDIRDLSRIEAGQMELYQETFSVAAMLNEVYVTARPGLEKSGNTLKMQVGEDVGEMDADRVKIQQTLLNLLSAAAGFLPGGTVLLGAGRERDSRGEWITFRLADSSAEHAPPAADALQKTAGLSEPPRFSGHGLALVMARRFCQMQGGELTGSREPGAGAVFQLRFPR